MACSKCEHKGFTESSFFANGGIFSSIGQCRHCDDIKAYSDEVQKRKGIVTMKKPQTAESECGKVLYPQFGRRS